MGSGVFHPRPPAAPAVSLPPEQQYPCRATLPGTGPRTAPECSSAEHPAGATAQGNPSVEVAGGAGAGRGMSRSVGSVFATVAAVALGLFGAARVDAQPVSVAGPTCRDAANPTAPTLESVATNVWRVAAARGDPDAANRGLTIQLVLVRDGTRRWLVGSGPSPAFGAALACAVQRATGGAVTDIVNTRAAPELAMGNAAFAGARRWALPDVIAAMRTRCPQCQDRLRARIGEAGASLQPDSIRAPSRPVPSASGGRHGSLGPFDTLALERAPGERTLALRLRTAPLVIAQGLVWAGDLPDLRETDSAVLGASLRRLRVFAGGRRVLGEQGPAASVAAIDAHLAYLDALRDAITPLLQRGELPGSAAAAADLPAFASLPGYASWHPLNVQHVWRELEPALFR